MATASENNTLALSMNGWDGWWIDADSLAMDSIAKTFHRQIAAGHLTTLKAAVTAENVESLLAGMGVPREFDVLSLDIDRNTYRVWAAMTSYQPRIAVIEYNAAFPPEVDWKIEYRADRMWNETSDFGASLKAFELLGRKMGYALVGCDFIGTNAFFVRADLCGDKFCEPFTAENHYEPPRYGLASRQGHTAGFER